MGDIDISKVTVEGFGSVTFNKVKNIQAGEKESVRIIKKA